MSQAKLAQPTITVAVVTLNEEQHMAEWLRATEWADERVVIDGGSHDATISIARESNARVLVRPFDNFANQRNVAIQAASCDWILFIDADERATPALVRELRDRVTFAREVAFRVPIRSRIFGKPFRFSGTQDDRPLRLLRRGAGRWHGAVHEVYQCRGPRGTLHGWLDHHTMPDRAAFYAKVERYTSLEAASRVAANRAPRWHERWVAPPREVFRRLLWKQGWLDGPAGWTFSVLSGWSEWVLACKHRELWQQRSRGEGATVEQLSDAPKLANMQWVGS